MAKKLKHFFDPTVAKEVGINAAIIMERIAYWTEDNEANNHNFIDGNYWIFNSVKAWSEIFYYLSAKQINTALSKLIECEYLVRANYNRVAYDRTYWYAMTDKARGLYGFIPLGKSICTKGKMENYERENGNIQNGKPIPIKDPIKDSIKDDIEELSSLRDKRKPSELDVVEEEKYGRTANLDDDDFKTYARKIIDEYEYELDCANSERIDEHLIRKVAKQYDFTYMLTLRLITYAIKERQAF